MQSPLSQARQCLRPLRIHQLRWQRRLHDWHSGVRFAQGRVTVGIGGGLCQLANLIHWMALHTAADEGRVLRFGSGASLFYNYVDLRFRNPTDQPMQLLVRLDATHLCGEIRTLEPPPLAYHVVEKDHRYEQEGGLRFRCNTIWQRQIDRRSGQLVHKRCLDANRSRVMD